MFSSTNPLLKEALRKFLHLLQVFTLMAYTFLAETFSKQTGLLFLTALMLLLLEFEYFRIEYKSSAWLRLREIFEKWVARKKEKNNMVSGVFFIISAIICFAVFDYKIALAALLFFIFGDLTSAITGMLWGKKKIFRNKTYIGTFYGFIANLLVGYVVLTGEPQIFIPMAVTASFVEAITQKLDDNLTVPLFSGFIGQLIVFYTRI